MVPLKTPLSSQAPGLTKSRAATSWYFLWSKMNINVLLYYIQGGMIVTSCAKQLNMFLKILG